MRSWQRPTFLPPGLVDQRGDGFLMVWGDLPYWTVVDAELRDFLGLLDGTRTLAEATGALAGRRQAKEARKAVEVLASRGVVTCGTEVGPQLRPGEARIENIAVNVTRRCNLRCPFCYNSDGASASAWARQAPAWPLPSFCYDSDGASASAEDELGVAEIISVLESSRPFWGRTVALSILGGEPLLDEAKTLGLIEYASQNGLAPIVSTNGTRVTASFAEQAARYAAEVQVSIDGARAETSERVRGSGSFARALEGVRMLVAAGVHTILSMVCHQGNASELEEFYETGLRLGVSEVRFIPLKRIGGTDASEFKPVPLDELIAAAVALFREHPEYRPLTGRDALSILAGSCQYAVRRASCGTGVQTFLLDANGDMYPCLNTNTCGLRVANARDPGFSFATVWQDSPILRDVRGRTAIDSETNACWKCEVRHWCLGGCRGETLETRGDLRLNAWNCGEQRRAVVETMWALSETPDIVRRAQALEL